MKKPLIVTIAQVVLTLSMLYGMISVLVIGLVGISSGSPLFVLVAIGFALLFLFQIKAAFKYREKWALIWNGVWLVVYTSGTVMAIFMSLVQEVTGEVLGLLIGIVPLTVLVWHGRTNGRVG